MRFLMVLALCLFSLTPRAGAEVLNIDLASDQVDITTGFDGARLVLFGVKEREGDIAVVIQGPERDMIVRRKDTIFGAWMNRSSMKFRRVPVYYDYAMNKGEEELAPKTILSQYKVGLNALRFTPDRRGESEKTAQDFQEALIRNKQAQGLFPVKAKDIVFLSDDFFRTSFKLPSNVPTGEYTISTYLFNKGKLISQKERKLWKAETRWKIWPCSNI